MEAMECGWLVFLRWVISYANEWKDLSNKGLVPGEDWQVPVFQGYKYLLVMIDTFTGWIEGFLTRTEKAEEVVKKLLHEIIPRFGLPRSLQNDNGTSFTSKVTQGVSKALGITYCLHCTCRLQSSRKVFSTPTPVKVPGHDSWIHYS